MDKHGNIARNSPSALQRFDRPLAEPEERALRNEVTAAVIGLVCLLGLIGWALGSL